MKIGSEGKLCYSTFMPKSAQRLKSLPPYFFAVQGQRIQTMRSQGLDVISLDIGSPDLPPPPAVVDALDNAARSPNNHGYAGYRGIPTFRRAVAHYYQKRFDVVLDPDNEVLPLIGSKEGIVNLALAYLDQGDIALVPDVGYPSYSMGARLAGAEVCWLPVSEETSYLPLLADIPDEVSSRAKLLWVNYPNNPTGATADQEFYMQVVDYCHQRDILLASDNPYVDVTYDGYVASSVLQVDRAKACTVEFMSFSKTYNMGGWRLGAAVGNAEALKSLLQIKSNMDSGHFVPIYEAGIAAIECTSDDWIVARNHVYQNRRDRILEVLPAIGLSAQKPKGSLYIWARVLDGNGQTYVREALAQALVALASGDAYGPGGDHYVRISLGVPDDKLDIALSRLKRWYANR
jgi:LL-diaminopimelate aminotransferase